MDDLNHLFELQGVAYYTHARAVTSATRAAGRAALADIAARLDAARTPFAPAACSA